MSQIAITKQAAAQRQLDAAIRMLFAGEDFLAVHTLAFASHEVISVLDGKQAGSGDDLYRRTLDGLNQSHPGAFSGHTPDSFRRWIGDKNRKGANFLKHAERDHNKALDPSVLSTDHLLLEACVMYRNLGLSPTNEMNTFGQWHLAVYPNAPGDAISLDQVSVHKLPRAAQLRFGQWLLDEHRKESEGADSG